MNRISTFMEKTPESSHPFSHSKTAVSEPGSRPSANTVCWHLDRGLSSLLNREKEMFVV